MVIIATNESQSTQLASLPQFCCDFSSESILWAKWRKLTLGFVAGARLFLTVIFGIQERSYLNQIP